MRRHALIIAENAAFDLDVRVRLEASTLLRAGWRVTVVCPRDADAGAHRAREPGLQVLDFPPAPRMRGVAGYVVEYAWAVAAILARVAAVTRRDVDVVQVCNPPDVLFVPALVARFLRGAAVVYDQHDLVPELFAVKFGHSGPLAALLRLCERLSYAAADVVVSTNESYRDVVLSRGRRRPADVYVVRNGPDDAMVAQATPAALRRSGPFTVGYLGIMGEQDGVDVLVRAAAHVVRRMGRRDIRFVLIGDGPARAAAETLTRDLGVADAVRFTGILRGRTMYETLAKADVGVAPDPRTVYADRSTMVKVMEYMALGLPVVQFDLTEGRRTAGDAALYAGPNDPSELARCIVTLLDDPERRATMSRAGRDRVAADLAWSTQAPSLLAAYEAALAKASRRRGAVGWRDVLRARRRDERSTPPR